MGEAVLTAASVSATIGSARTSLTEAVEDVLICTNQTRLAGDNLVSVHGAEEDGVENRVDTSSPGSGESPGGSQSRDGSETGAAASGTAAAGPAAPLYKPASGSTTTPSLMAPRSTTANGGSSGQSALSGAATSARGLAAKVGASFSGMSKPKPRSKPRPVGSQVRRPRPGGPQASPSYPQQGIRPGPAGQPQTRSAVLSLQRVEPLSVMKFSFMISLVAWVVLFIAVAVIYFTLSKLGVFAKIEQTVGLVTTNKNHPGSNAASWFRASRVLEYTALVCTVNAILFTALATVGAALYNLVTVVTGGIEVTLKESD